MATIVPFWGEERRSAARTSPSRGVGGAKENEEKNGGEKKETGELFAHNSYFEHFLNLLPAAKYFPSEGSTSGKKAKKKKDRTHELQRRRSRLDPKQHKTVTEMQKELAQASKRTQNVSLKPETPSRNPKSHKLSKSEKNSSNKNIKTETKTATPEENGSKKKGEKRKAPEEEGSELVKEENGESSEKSKKVPSKKRQRKKQKKVQKLPPKKEVEKVSIAELRRRMKERLQTMHNDRQPKDRPYLEGNERKSQKKRKKEKQEREKKEKKKKKKSTNVEEDAAKFLDIMKEEMADEEEVDSEGNEIEEDLSYGKLLTKTKNVKPIKRKKGKSKQRLLQEVQAKKEKIASMNEEDAEEFLEQESFKKVMKLIDGEKVKDDEKRLKAALKKESRRKKESGKKWKKLKAAQDRAVSDKQDRRRDNIELKTSKKRKKFHKPEVES